MRAKPRVSVCAPRQRVALPDLQAADQNGWYKRQQWWGTGQESVRVTAIRGNVSLKAPRRRLVFWFVWAGNRGTCIICRPPQSEGNTRCLVGHDGLSITN